MKRSITLLYYAAMFSVAALLTSCSESGRLKPRSGERLLRKSEVITQAGYATRRTLVRVTTASYDSAVYVSPGRHADGTPKDFQLVFRWESATLPQSQSQAQAQR
jgi:hypothetical protein